MLRLEGKGAFERLRGGDKHEQREKEKEKPSSGGPESES